VNSLHAFDLDRTLLHCNSSYFFSIFLLKKKILSPYLFLSSFFLYLGFRFSLVSIERFHELAFERFLKGASWQILRELAAEFADRYFHKMLRQSAFFRLREAKERGDYTVILSSSPSFLVEPIAEKLKVSNFQATEYRVDKSKQLCEISSLMLGEQKAKALKDYANKVSVKKENTIAYSDSAADIPFLEAAGKAVVFAPDRKFRKLCKEKGWETLNV
jgi:HAD superfamily hydrolase (TIGR01490 family)